MQFSQKVSFSKSKFKLSNKPLPTNELASFTACGMKRNAALAKD